MSEVLGFDSSLQELFRRGPKTLPKESFHSYSKEDLSQLHYQKLNLIRRTFFQTLRFEQGFNLSLYYPGSGADPIPASVFGENVVYSSKDEQDSDYFTWLMKNPQGGPIRYRASLREYGPFPNLKVLYADISNSPFLNGSLDIVVVNYLPNSLVRNSIFEISRLLRPNGVFVFEAETSIDQNGNLQEGYGEVLARILAAGFTQHSLDKFGGAMFITYISKAHPVGSLPGLDWECIEGLEDTLSEYRFEDMGLLIPRREFVQKLKKGLPVTMHAHEIRVFQKPG